MGKIKVGDIVEFLRDVTGDGRYFKEGQKEVVTSISGCGAYYRVCGMASGWVDSVFRLVELTPKELADEYRRLRIEARELSDKLTNLGYKLNIVTNNGVKVEMKDSIRLDTITFERMVDVEKTVTVKEKEVI